MYKLEKMELHEGETSRVSAGQTTEGDSLSIFNIERQEVLPLECVDDIEVGYQVYLTSAMRFHRTSPISEIVSSNENEVVFKTQTSTYKLSYEEDCYGCATQRHACEHDN